MLGDWFLWFVGLKICSSVGTTFSFKSLKYHFNFIVAALEKSFILYFEYGLWITHAFFLCLCFQFNGQRITQFLVYFYISAFNIFIPTVNVYEQRITRFLFLFGFFFLFASRNIFVSMMEILQIPISKMKCVWITSYRSGFNFL